MMKLSPSQIQRLSEKILLQWKNQNLITLKVDEKIVLQTIKDVITENMKQEDNLDKEVHQMLLQLEREHGDGFQKGKMFPMLKQKIAKEKKFIL